MNYQQSGRKKNIGLEACFTKKGSLQFTKIFSNLECKQHSTPYSHIAIDNMNNSISAQEFQIYLLCIKCLENKEAHSYIDYKVILQTIQIGVQLYNISLKNMEQVQQIKLEIRKFLENKFIRKQKIYSFYSLLNRETKIFLSSNNQTNIIPQKIVKTEYYKISNNFIKDMKKWIKQPSQFQSIYGIQMSKQNLRLILWLKFSLMLTINLFNALLNLLLQKEQNKILLLSQSLNESQKMLDHIKSLINLRKKEIIFKKTSVLKNAYAFIKSEVKFQVIERYLRQFIDLFDNYDKNFNCKYPYKFKITTSELFSNFILNIPLTTVILKDSNLNKEPYYQQQSYENQFRFINDGQYVFKNQYRPNILCQEDFSQLQRSSNALIGKQYLPISKYQKIEQFSNIKIIQIEPFLKSNEKIYLRIRLNKEGSDIISIGVRWSNSSQIFLKGINQFYIDIKLKVIPDIGQNSQLYYKYRDQIKALKSGNKIYKAARNSLRNQDEIFLILQDDIISICYFCQSGHNFVKFTNETRKKVFKVEQLYRKKQSICGTIQTTFPLYGAIALQKTITQIQVFNMEAKNKQL